MDTSHFATTNVKAAPASTALGVLGGLAMALQALPGGQFPTTAMGWAQLGMAAAFGVVGALSK